jgi:predicted enzyme related to lactoylglutathione lyase
MITSLAFVVYPVSNIAAARTFYEGILGLRMTYEFGGKWFEYRLGNTAFVIAATDTTVPVTVRGALAVFEVADLDAEVARLKGLAIPVAGGIRETSLCRFVTLRDPDGSEIILHQPKVRPWKGSPTQRSIQ